MVHREICALSYHNDYVPHTNGAYLMPQLHCYVPESLAQQLQNLELTIAIRMSPALQP